MSTIIEQCQEEYCTIDLRNASTWSSISYGGVPLFLTGVIPLEHTAGTHQTVLRGRGEGQEGQLGLLFFRCGLARYRLWPWVHLQGTRWPLTSRPFSPATGCVPMPVLSSGPGSALELVGLYSVTAPDDLRA